MDTLGAIVFRVHCSEVVCCLEVELYGQHIGRGQTVCPL